MLLRALNTSPARVRTTMSRLISRSVLAVVFVSLAVGLIAALAAGSPADAVPAHAASPGEEGQIAFVRFGSQPYIFVMRSNGSHKQKISPKKSDDEAPALSPSGARVAFLDGSGPANGRIGLMRPNGSDRHILRIRGFSAYEPSFAPSGRRLVLYGHRAKHSGGGAGIYTVGTDGSHLRQLTHKVETAPTFSPNGKLIAYQGFARGVVDYAIFVMRSDGSHSRMVAPDGIDPTFSPNGRRIVYSGINEDVPSQLFSVDLDGTHRRKLTKNDNGRVLYLSPSYSPGGRRIAFEQSIEHKNSDRSDIFTMGANGGDLKQLTHDGKSMDPSWGPRSH